MLHNNNPNAFHESDPLPVSLSSDQATSWPIWQHHTSSMPDDSRVVFLFSDFDQAYMGMGHDLYRKETGFRAALNRCDLLLRPLMDRSLFEVLWPTSETIRDSRYTHPAMFSLQYALSCLWHERGIHPDAVIGYGLGEYAAACIAGVFDLREALKLVCLRAGMQQVFPRDAWLLEAQAPTEVVRPICTLLKAEVNLIAPCEGRTLITGSLEALTRVEALLKSRDITINNDISQGAETMKDRIGTCFHQVFADTLLKEPKITFISTLTGTEVSQELTNPEYWTHQLVWPSCFDQAVSTLLEEQYQIFVELGPRSQLCKMGRDLMGQRNGLWLASMRQGIDEEEQLRHCLEKLFKTGVPVSLPAFVNNP